MTWNDNLFNINLDKYLYSATRSFKKGDFYHNIKKQPSNSLKFALYYRIKDYDYNRINDRISKGNYLKDLLKDSFSIPGIKTSYNNYWIFALLSENKSKYIKYLRKNKFYASNIHGVCAYKKELKNANYLIENVFYLPFYNEISYSKLKQMAERMKQKYLSVKLDINNRGKEINFSSPGLIIGLSYSF